MDKKFISILIPLYNGIEYLDESLKSIIDQTYKNWEIIIGINGKYNDTKFINKVYNIVNRYNNNNNIKIINFDIKGKSITLNKLILHSKYDYIAILDVDDIWINNKLELQIKYLDDYDVIGTKCEYFGDLNNFQPNIPTGDLSNFDFLTVNPIINSSVIIKKKYCYWDDNFEGLEDYNLWLSLYFKKIKFFNLDKILCYHRIHKNSAFNNTNNNNLNLLKNKWNFFKYY